MIVIHIFQGEKIPSFIQEIPWGRKILGKVRFM